MLKNRIIMATTITFIILICCNYGLSQSDESHYDVSEVSDICFVWVDHDGAITVEEFLSPHLFSAFLTDFSQLSDRTYWNDPVDWIYGSAIMISFYDGSYYMINNYCTIHYCDGETDDTRQYYGAEEFEVFWKQYCQNEYRHD